MAIEKANILVFVNRALKISETDIDDDIQAVLDDLSEEDLLEASDDSINLVANDASFTPPTDLRDISAITLTDASGVSRDPLLEIPGGINRLRRIKNSDSSTGTPRHYVWFNSLIHLWRSADAAYDVLFEYTKNHAQGVDTIEFPDIFKNTINYGVTAEVSARFNRTAGINVWFPRYQVAKQKRIDSKPEQPSISRGASWDI